MLGGVVFTSGPRAALKPLLRRTTRRTVDDPLTRIPLDHDASGVQQPMISVGPRRRSRPHNLARRGFLLNVAVRQRISQRELVEIHHYDFGGVVDGMYSYGSRLVRCVIEHFHRLRSCRKLYGPIRFIGWLFNQQVRGLAAEALLSNPQRHQSRAAVHNASFLLPCRGRDATQM